METVHPERWLRGASEHCQRTGRPMVTLSFAQSVDGSLTTRRGIPLTLSGPKSLQLTHRLRSAHDAIAVGIGTVLADDPQLTVRLVEGSQPRPVVLDSRLRIPLEARLLQNPKPPWIAAAGRVERKKQVALEARGARILQLPLDPKGGVDLLALLERLASSGITSLMVEGGARVISGFLCRRLVERVVITVSPVLVGGLRAVEQQLTPAPRLHEIEFLRLGDDLIVSGIPEWETR